MSEEQKKENQKDDVAPGIYRHFKGKDYKVFFVAKHSETAEEFVVYEKLDNRTFWVRPKQMFLETVKVEDREVKRFEFVSPLLDEKKEMENKYKRALADYDNLKKETAKEREEMGRFAMGMAAAAFLEVFENYKKAMGHQPDLKALTKEIKEITEISEIEGRLLPKLKEVGQWLEGVGHIKNQFAETLKQMGIEEIKTVGEKFNPVVHEAVGEEKVEGKEPGVVVREVEGGYKMGERVIKAAKVIVSKNS